MLTRKPVKRRRAAAPRSASRRFPEREVQVAVLQWLQLYNPLARKCIIKIDNEGKRKTIISNGKSIPVGDILAVKMGLHVGASDLFLAYPTDRYPGLWVEVKPPLFKVTKSNREHFEKQMEFIILMRDRGYYADVGVGVDQCIEIFKTYLKGR